MLNKKVILITGVSSGFGKAMTDRFLNDGHTIYGTSRKQISSEGNLTVLPVDITDLQSVANAVDEILKNENHIDVVINNAGMGISGAAELSEQQDIDLQMNINFIGVVNVCRTVLPIFRKQRNGLIINISSIGGVFSLPYQGFYSASKFAVEGYSQALSLETQQFGIKIIVVEPGDFNTGFTQNRVICQRTINEIDYAQSYSKVLQNIEKDETTGASPDYLAKKISKIIQKKNPKFRYVITPNLIQKISVFASKILPANWFLAIIRKFYNV
jgi:short-subunit dehydrogenase